MTHGTFSNRHICRGLARFLAQKGFSVWILEWRGHGASNPARSPFDFETIAMQDIPAALDYLYDTQKLEQLHCVTHSGGGISLVQCLIHFPHYKQRLHRLVLFNCQAFGAAVTPMRRIKLRAFSAMSRLLGRVPGALLGIGPQDESFFTMKQWFDWNIRGTFMGQDGIDYRSAMKDITLPTLFLSAEGDRYIAPKAGCGDFFNAFSPSDKYWVHCSRDRGFREDYSHSRLILSRAAAAEIWPLTVHWLREGSVPAEISVSPSTGLKGVRAL